MVTAVSSTHTTAPDMWQNPCRRNNQAVRQHHVLCHAFDALDRDVLSLSRHCISTMQAGSAAVLEVLAALRSMHADKACLCLCRSVQVRAGHVHSGGRHSTAASTLPWRPPHPQQLVRTPRAAGMFDLHMSTHAVCDIHVVCDSRAGEMPK
jgi:hypothetical protein